MVIIIFLLVIVDKKMVDRTIKKNIKENFNSGKAIVVMVAGKWVKQLFKKKLNEPLTGRKWKYELFHKSREEYENKIGHIEAEQQEIDFVEEKEGRISGFELKWSPQKKKIPQKFLDTYKANGFVIDRNNFRDFSVI